MANMERLLKGTGKGQLAHKIPSDIPGACSFLRAATGSFIVRPVPPQDIICWRE